ncbi:MAG: hypothetical protein VX379_02940, partial [Pseudomonadota bacterium]|nr:hypothetical protein [Pseudomonadota bacterium]MEE3320366.1 hypothetical protein [Pseudomonadota bacterium]
AIITMEHKGYLLVLVSGLGTFIRTGNPRFFNEMCQIWSELIHIKRRSGDPVDSLVNCFI